MKPIEWNKEKNDWLKECRNVSFEDVIDAMKAGRVLETVDHPNKQRYPNQKMYVVQIKNYVYLVPFVEDSEKVFLKTVIPSRKARRKQLKRKEAL